MSYVATAPAKIILVGEHAVVYGIPAIAVPVNSMRACARIRRTRGSLAITAADIGRKVVYGEQAADEATRQLTLLLKHVVDRLDLSDPKGEIIVTSSIPIASGLGSSAAVSTAVARAIAYLHDRQLSLDKLNDIVFETETIYHGTPSGIDNTVVVYQSPIYFIKNRSIEKLKSRDEFHFLIADSGRPASTRDAVDHVRTLYHGDRHATVKIFEDICRIVDSAKSCLQNGHASCLGRLMVQNHRLLQQLQVSSARMDTLVEAALAAGALGAKMSGGGMGGNMIALVNSANHNDVKLALINAGAVEVRRFVLRQEQESL